MRHDQIVKSTHISHIFEIYPENRTFEVKLDDMGLFGKDKKPDPKEQVNEWCRKIRKERNGLDRQVRQIERGEAQAVASIKQAAKKGDPASAKVSKCRIGL